MGKIKRERQKFHITSTVNDEADTAPPDTVHEVPKFRPLPKQLDVTENIFAGINIQLDQVKKFSESKPAPPQAPSTRKEILDKATVKYGQPERQLTKKEKLKLRHEKLLQKIDVIQQAKQKFKEKLKQNKGKIASAEPNVKSFITKPMLSSESIAIKKPLGNLKSIRKELVSLNDSLPSLDSIYRLKSKYAKTGLDQVMTLKSKQRKNKSKSMLATPNIQSSSKIIMKETKKEAKKDYVKSYDLFRKLLKTAKSTSSATGVLPNATKQKKYPKK